MCGDLLRVCYPRKRAVVLFKFRLIPKGIHFGVDAPVIQILIDVGEGAHTNGLETDGGAWGEDSFITIAQVMREWNRQP